MKTKPESESERAPVIPERATSGQTLQPSPRPHLVIPNCRLVALHRQEVPSQVPGNSGGQLVVIGTELQDGDPMPPADRILSVDFDVLAIELKPQEQVADNRKILIKNDPKTYRMWKDGDELEPSQLAIARIARKFRRLEVGDEVKAGQSLGVVNPAISFDQLAIRKARLAASEADHDLAISTREEAKERYETTRRLNAQGKAASDEEVRGAELTWKRYRSEVLTREQAIRVCAAELMRVQTALQMHVIRSTISGTIKEIYKNLGDAVYPSESVFQIQNADWLRVEGQMDVQHLSHLRQGMEVVVEPPRAVRPALVLTPHLQEITSVAVSQGPKPLVLSAGEDRTVRILDPRTGTRLRTLRHPAAVRAVACTPTGSQRNLCLSGAADGIVRLWGLDDLSQPARELSPRHKGAVTCAAFSPDGAKCATGGEDHTICLWDTRSGKLLYRIANAHDGVLTSLQFASDSRLVSAGRDGRLLVWEMSTSGPPQRCAEFEGRGGDVPVLGVSADGGRTFFDRGADLRIISVTDQETDAVFHNTTKDLSFATLALFSPDGKLVLTGGAPEGGLKLWRAPTTARPAGELCRLIWSASPATAGAFAPDGSFVVSGTQDGNVLIWGTPSPEEVEQRLTARITLVEPFLNSSSGQVRIWAELKNPGFLIPGSSAVMVIGPAE